MMHPSLSYSQMIYLYVGYMKRGIIKSAPPFIPCHQKSLSDFLDEFWVYYRELIAYKNSPSLF